MSNYTVRMIFPTCIHEYIFDKINAKEIIDFCYQQKEKNPIGQTKSNRGGWHSQFFNLTDDNIISHTLAEGLGRSIFTSIKPELKMEMSYWIMINSPNTYNVSHTHPDAHFSGVLWVKVPKNSGKIKFDNPFSHTGFVEIEAYLDTVNETTGFHHAMVIDPEVGKMLTFPSSLRHEVFVNESNEDRIAISFNMHITTN